MIFLTKFIEKLVNGNTRRLIEGTKKLVTMSDSEFERVMNKYEKEMDKTGDYEIPNWFTIQFRKPEKGLCEFIGTFHKGEEYDKVNKILFLELLKDKKIKFEKISDKEDIYKIIRH